MRIHRPASMTGAALLVLSAVACTGGIGSADRGTPATSPAAVATTATDGVVGPLCPMLPAGDEPGNPMFMQGLPPDEALTWIPVATVFEAAVRATEFGPDLTGGPDVTILVPSDDTFGETFSEDTLDDLLLLRTDEFRTLLERHIVEGARSLDDLAQAGSVTTMAGTTVTVTGAGETVQFDDSAGVLCGDYRASGSRIHVVDAVLGPLPEPAEEEEDAH